MSVVLDANVLISAVIQAGPPYRIVSRWLDVADLDVVICPAVLAEVEEVLGRPRLQQRIEAELAQLYLATSNGTIEFRPPSTLQCSKTCSALDSTRKRNPSEPAIVIDDRPARFAT